MKSLNSILFVLCMNITSLPFLLTIRKYDFISSSIIWQAGGSLDQLVSTKCWAQKEGFSHVQIFRFDNIAREIETIDDNKLLEYASSCHPSVKVILYIGATRTQIAENPNSLYWIRLNYAKFVKIKSKLEHIFGANSLLLQPFDEPKVNDMPLISQVCSDIYGEQLFLSANSGTLRLLPKISLKCFQMIDFHDYGLSANKPNLFLRRVDYFSSLIANGENKHLSASISLPLFVKYSNGAYSRRVFSCLSLQGLIMRRINAGYYGAHLSPNIGFLQEEELLNIIPTCVSSDV